jgi:hypothetical protein
VEDSGRHPFSAPTWRTIVAIAVPVGSVNLILFIAGVIAIVTLVALTAGKATLSEEFLLYTAVISYGLYLVASASLTFSLSSGSRHSWATSYLVSMFPFVLLTSWLPITAAWPC